MEAILLVMFTFVLIYGAIEALRQRGLNKDKVHPTRPTRRSATKPDTPAHIEDLNSPPEVLDLRALPSRRMRVVGTNHYSIARVSNLTVSTWLVIREPENEHDANAIGVFMLTGEQVGHIAASAARVIAPVLDASGYAKFLLTAVGSSGSTSARVWIDVPLVSALRQRVKEIADA